MTTKWKILTLMGMVASLIVLYLFSYRKTASEILRADQGVRSHLADLILLEPSELPKVNTKLVKLGKEFFFDARFSANGQISCATCHDPTKKFTDGLALAKGLESTERNSPSIIGSAMNHWFFWDGRADSLISQAVEPIENLKEHGISRTKLVNIIRVNYREKYESTFGHTNWRLLDRLPENALPDPRQPKDLPAVVFAYALNSASDLSFQTKIIKQAIDHEVSPVVFLQQEVLRKMSAKYPDSWISSWNHLTADQKILINSIFLNFAQAVASYEETILPAPSAFDRFGKKCLQSSDTQCRDVLSPDFNDDELVGFQIFTGKGQCILCHNGPNFTDQQFHNTGLADITQSLSNMGRSVGISILLAKEFSCGEVQHDRPLESCEESKYLDKENIEHVGAFKTPSLRNVADTAPYFHNGNFRTLDDVINFYAKLDSRTSVGHREESLKPFQISGREKEQLIKFLKSLSSESSF